MLETLGIGRDEADERFGFLIEALKHGAPPHGGIAFGLDRIVGAAGRRESIRDVIAFPKTASGADPLTGAPAPLEPEQLRELGIRVDAARAAHPAAVRLLRFPAARADSSRGPLLTSRRPELVRQSLNV